MVNNVDNSASAGIEHFESVVSVDASPEEVFDFLDDPERAGGHMSRSNWQTAGMRLTHGLDAPIRAERRRPGGAVGGG